MSKYIIIDSGTLGNTLQTHLDAADTMLIDSKKKSASEIADAIIKDKGDAVILLNADAETNNTNEDILDIVLWLRCKHKCLSPIVVYSIYSLEKLLQKTPTNYFIISTGCVFKEDVDVLSSIEEIKKLQPINSTDLTKEQFKHYLKPRVDAILKQYKHRMANYAGMALMLDIAKQVYDKKEDNQILKGKFPDFFAHRKSLDHALLSTYFGLGELKITTEQKQQFKKSNTKKILLVDDLADKGWQPIISQMLYGKHEAKEIISLTIQSKQQKGENKFNFEATKKSLETKIQSHKPHLILLDLRLNDETREIHPTQLGGYKLLTFLKNNPKYKGVPVIMFTASKNAETIKTLLNAGAEAVWTKPGIDEGLNVRGIIKRYEQLLKLTDEIFKPNYETLNGIQDQTDERYGIDNLNIEEIRQKLKSKLDYIRYRIALSEKEAIKQLPNNYQSADAIYIDANALITGERDIYYHELIASVLKLSLLTKDSEFKYINGNSKEKNVTCPKVVIMNSVYDEVIKIYKAFTFKRKPEDISQKFQKYELSCYRASMSLTLIKDLFNDKCVRTEFGKWDVSWQLENPKENLVADGYIIDEVSNLVLWNREKNNKSLYPKDTKAICITDDNGLTFKLKSLKDEKGNSVIPVISLQTFVQDMNKIVL